jgi:hypothetical protein
MRILIAMVLALALSSFAFAGATSPLVDLPLVAGKDEASITKALGKPASTEKSKYGPKKTYKLAAGVDVEIVFIQGKADWITVTPGPKVRVPFGPDALRALGLPSASPSVSSPAVLRWSNTNNLLDVSIFPAGPNVGYWYIKARTQ